MCLIDAGQVGTIPFLTMGNPIPLWSERPNSMSLGRTALSNKVANFSGCHMAILEESGSVGRDGRAAAGGGLVSSSGRSSSKAAVAMISQQQQQQQ